MYWKSFSIKILLYHRHSYTGRFLLRPILSILRLGEFGSHSISPLYKKFIYEYTFCNSHDIWSTMSSIDSLKSLSTHSRTYWVIPIVKKLIQNSSCCFIAGCVLSCVKDPQDILLAIRGYIARFKYGSSAFARIFLMITRFSFIHCKKLFIAYSHVTSSYIRLSCTNSYSNAFDIRSYILSKW